MNRPVSRDDGHRGHQSSRHRETSRGTTRANTSPQNRVQTCLGHSARPLLELQPPTQSFIRRSQLSGIETESQCHVRRVSVQHRKVNKLDACADGISRTNTPVASHWRLEGSLAKSGADFTHAVEIPFWRVLPQAGPRSGRNADCANRFGWHADILQQTAVTSRRKAMQQRLVAQTTRYART